jgi:UPF0755 protein
MIRLLKTMLAIGLIGLLLALAGGGWFYWRVSAPLPLAGERVEFHVAPGSGMRLLARDVAAAGVDFEPWMLVALARLRKVDGSLKAGSYEITRGASLLDLLGLLERGEVSLAGITFVEGWTFRQMRERLAAHPDLKHDSKDLSDAGIMRRIGIGHPDRAAPDGWIFPDTYRFAKRSSDFDILKQAHQAMTKHLEREWERREEALPLSDPYQALILASIVEKETGRDADRPLVAAVFRNRLRQGMPLQSDPTVIYGLGASFDGNLRKSDLAADTPYNTYVHAGLPPTPIAMPGLASLRATLHPAPSPALYFVARGDGSSQFSGTLEEHNRAVNRYQRRGVRKARPDAFAPEKR